MCLRSCVCVLRFPMVCVLLGCLSDASGAPRGSGGQIEVNRLVFQTYGLVELWYTVSPATRLGSEAPFRVGNLRFRTKKVNVSLCRNVSFKVTCRSHSLIFRTMGLILGAFAAYSKFGDRWAQFWTC